MNIRHWVTIVTARSERVDSENYITKNKKGLYLFKLKYHTIRYKFFQILWD